MALWVNPNREPLLKALWKLRTCAHAHASHRTKAIRAGSQRKVHTDRLELLVHPRLLHRGLEAVHLDCRLVMHCASFMHGSWSASVHRRTCLNGGRQGRIKAFVHPHVVVTVAGEYVTLHKIDSNWKIGTQHYKQRSRVSNVVDSRSDDHTRTWFWCP